ncbi:MAG: quinone-dependent dihydroorotate dehydrogenase [Anaerolineales bacterium]
MYPFFRALLFRLEPEAAHHLTLQLLRLGGLPPFAPVLRALFAAPDKPVSAFGLTFRNPVGLAAGYDKDGVAIAGLAALGFGHIEIGTVTPRPQPGNPRPRVFRLVKDEAVINRMGFPGQGMEVVHRHVARLKNRQGVVLGLNLGKNKDTPLEDATQDYLALMRTFTPLADYLAINISSPNTVGLRRLQGRAMLEELLGAIAREREEITLGRGGRAPILVKLAPDLSEDELDDAVGVILDTGMDGIIATNTTLAREGLRSRHQTESGGLSGKPLTMRSEAVLAGVLRRAEGRIPVISAGGVMTPDDAKRRLDMGAALVQVYTGLVYAGPGLVKAIIKSL